MIYGTGHNNLRHSKNRSPCDEHKDEGEEEERGHFKRVQAWAIRSPRNRKPKADLCPANALGAIRVHPPLGVAPTSPRRLRAQDQAPRHKKDSRRDCGGQGGQRVHRKAHHHRTRRAPQLLQHPPTTCAVLSSGPRPKVEDVPHIPTIVTVAIPQEEAGNRTRMACLPTPRGWAVTTRMQTRAVMAAVLSSPRLAEEAAAEAALVYRAGHACDTRLPAFLSFSAIHWSGSWGFMAVVQNATSRALWGVQKRWSLATMAL